MPVGRKELREAVRRKLLRRRYDSALSLAEHAGLETEVLQIRKKQVEDYEGRQEFTKAYEAAHAAGLDTDANRIYKKGMKFYRSMHFESAISKLAHSAGNMDLAIRAAAKSNATHAAYLAEESGRFDIAMKYYEEDMQYDQAARAAEKAGMYRTAGNFHVKEILYCDKIGFFTESRNFGLREKFLLAAVADYHRSGLKDIDSKLDRVGLLEDARKIVNLAKFLRHT